MIHPPHVLPTAIPAPPTTFATIATPATNSWTTGLANSAHRDAKSAISTVRTNATSAPIVTSSSRRSFIDDASRARITACDAIPPGRALAMMACAIWDTCTMKRRRSVRRVRNAVMSA
mmetsp:Transcript_27544/g.58190  ORF Transcript_27544/g.58190 Transcript_27544/m.58190 type:complete len:118 (-) Transcript_27544:1019-1372(-)